jgi:hypothetical protein
MAFRYPPQGEGGSGTWGVARPAGKAVEGAEPYPQGAALPPMNSTCDSNEDLYSQRLIISAVREKIVRRFRRALFGAVAVTCLAVGHASATVLTYNIDWTGNNNYSLTGMFSFDDSTVGPSVDGGELLSFMIEGFNGTTSLGSFSGTPENFNFNVASQQFGVGGLSGGSNGQLWNFLGTGVGFGSGFASQVLTVGTNSIGDSEIPVGASTLTATLKPPSPVPLPAALPLFLTMLGGMGFLKWRKRKLQAA